LNPALNVETGKNED